EPVRQRRVDVEQTIGRVGPNAEDGLEQVEYASGRPGLGDVGTSVLDREAGDPSGETCVELGQTIALMQAGRLKDVPGDLARLVRKAISLETESDDAVVVRPDRSQLVGKRVVGRVV